MMDLSIRKIEHKKHPIGCFCFCERAVKRCVKVGKNSEKVCDFALLTTRQIGICLLCVEGTSFSDTLIILL